MDRPAKRGREHLEPEGHPKRLHADNEDGVCPTIDTLPVMDADDTLPVMDADDTLPVMDADDNMPVMDAVSNESEPVVSENPSSDVIPKERPDGGRSQALDFEPENKEKRIALIKRQVEYYFSDENLCQDRFFNEKISANAEGWLPISCVTSCRRIQQLGGNIDDIREALKDSELEMFGEFKETPESEETTWAIRRKSPIPTLQPRQPRNRPQKPDNNRPGRAADIHGGGCIIQMQGIPEEASCVAIKSALSALLPQNPEESHGMVRFVDTPRPDGSSKGLLASFDNDLEFLKTFKSFELNGSTVTVEIISDVEIAYKFIESLPQTFRRRRDREVQRRRKEINRKPINIGGLRFDSVDHLRKCLKDILNHTTPGKPVNVKTGGVLKGLLKYHINAESKLRDVQEFKVDMVAVKDPKPGNEHSRCFFVVRSDGSCEDFSIQKCLTRLAANPPFVKDSTTEDSPNEDEKKDVDHPAETEGKNPAPLVDTMDEIKSGNTMDEIKSGNTMDEIKSGNTMDEIKSV